MREEDILQMVRGGSVVVTGKTFDKEVVIEFQFPVMFIKNVFINGQNWGDYTVYSCGIKLQNLPEGEKEIYIEYEPVR